MEYVKFEANFNSLYSALRKLGPEISKELRKELYEVAKGVALEVRKEVPHNMKPTAVKWGFYSTKGAYVVAKAPVGTYDGSRRRQTFRHPVFAKAGSDRSTWHWAEQPTKPILEDTWDKMGTAAQLRSEEAIQRAVDRVMNDRL